MLYIIYMSHPSKKQLWSFLFLPILIINWFNYEIHWGGFALPMCTKQYKTEIYVIMIK